MSSGSPKKYKATAKGVMEWANSELEHVGRIASVEDPDLQYSYALSTVNGMLHLRNALYELVNDANYKTHHEDLQRLHDKVVRVLKHLIGEYKVDLGAIRAFNTRKVLGDLSFLNTVAAVAAGGRRRTRRRSNA